MTATYDAADHITQVDSTTAAGSHRLQYSYDSLDRVTQRTLSGGGIATPEVTSSWLAHAQTGAGCVEYEFSGAPRVAHRVGTSQAPPPWTTLHLCEIARLPLINRSLLFRQLAPLHRGEIPATLSPQ
jgi:YD repeat-containing protein